MCLIMLLLNFLLILNTGKSELAEQNNGAFSSDSPTGEGTRN